MNFHAMRSHRRFGLPALALVLFVMSSAAFMFTATQAQSPAKKVLTVDDYTRWRSISGQEISGDGKWVAYVLSYANTLPADQKPVLHLLNLETNQALEVPNATASSFSADSRWIAYQVDPSGGRGGRGGRGRGTTPAGGVGSTAPVSSGDAQGGAPAAPPTPPQRVELRNLATGAVQSWQDIESFTFSANSSHLILRRRPATAAAAGAAGRGAAGSGTGSASTEASSTPSGPRGVDVILHNLTTGRFQLLGSVGDIGFNKAGDLLAYTVDSATKDSNGLFVIDSRNGRVNTLDTDAKNFNRLTWSEDGMALAVLKGLEIEKMREPENMLLAFPDVQASLGDAPPAPVTLDPAKADGFPKGWVVSDRAALSWSNDKKRVFFGIKEQVAAPATGPRKSTDEVADVDVWNTADERIQSVQIMRADTDRNFTFRQAFDVSAARFVKLADATMRDLDVALDGRWAVGRDTRGYIHDYKRAAADIYRVNTTTGERTLMLKNQLINTSTGNHTFGISTDGHFFLYWKDNKYQAYDLDTATTRTLGGSSPVNFIDMEFDHPGPRPSYGIAGYTNDGKAVVVQQRYDLWLLPLDGSAPRNLTNGLGIKNETRFRYVRAEPPDQPSPGVPGSPGAGGRGGGAAQRWTIDLSKPITLSAYGEYTKKAGFYELAGGQLKQLVYEDAFFSSPTKAAKADKFLFTRETFAEFPDLRVSGPDFKDAKKISDANPQQAEYLWGRRIQFDYKNKNGVRLQGILALPDDYKPGEKRPMIVTFYEKNSQNLNRYSAPSYLSSMGSSPIQAVSEGYLTMLPDIYFRTGASHSDRLFAAVAMGAGVTDLSFDFNQNWGWSYQVMSGNGANQPDYYLYNQGREGVSPWENPEMYHFESALTHVPEVTAPFLIMHGTADPTVAFNNGLAFYNAMRFNNKNAILLAYPGEGHSLRGLANRKDLTIRYFQFFNHYLKGAPAPKWMKEGVPFLEKDANRDK
jgi:hypothetical protein